MAEHSTLGQNVPKSPAPPEGLFLMDGIEGLRSLPQHSVDMLLTDPPYGTTRNFWDVPLPLPELWEAVRWAVKPEGAVLFFAQCPYDKVLGASNLPMLRYEWVWYKSRCTGFLNARRAPLKRTENILVFYQKLPYYDPQFEQGKPYKKTADRGGNSPNYGKFVRSGGGSEDGLRFPGNLLTFPSVQRTVHPTQKPVELCEYFIKTYTRPGGILQRTYRGRRKITTPQWGSRSYVRSRWLIWRPRTAHFFCGPRSRSCRRPCGSLRRGASLIKPWLLSG